mmetsp:Transcript_15359/g.49029  ORF Transcript_15359/g.49029 Transcript_15359/m.49029 type:complete len:233 (+) Transcript_15359:413-1111(+)
MGQAARRPSPREPTSARSPDGTPPTLTPSLRSTGPGRRPRRCVATRSSRPCCVAWRRRRRMRRPRCLPPSSWRPAPSQAPAATCNAAARTWTAPSSWRRRCCGAVRGTLAPSTRSSTPATRRGWRLWRWTSERRTERRRRTRRTRATCPRTCTCAWDASRTPRQATERRSFGRSARHCPALSWSRTFTPCSSRRTRWRSWEGFGRRAGCWSSGWRRRGGRWATRQCCRCART